MSRPVVSDLNSHLGFWLRFVSNHVSQAFAAKLAETGVTVAEWVILRQMYGRESVTGSVLASETGLTKGAISKLIERLLAKDLIGRTERDGDRRVQDLALTATGRRAVPKLATLADRNDEEFFASLAPDERRILRGLLQKLVEAHGLKEIPTE